MLVGSTGRSLLLGRLCEEEARPGRGTRNVGRAGRGRAGDIGTQLQAGGFALGGTFGSAWFLKEER